MAAVYGNLSISEHSTQLREAVIDFIGMTFSRAARRM